VGAELPRPWVLLWIFWRLLGGLQPAEPIPSSPSQSDTILGTSSLGKPVVIGKHAGKSQVPLPGIPGRVFPAQGEEKKFPEPWG